MSEKLVHRTRVPMVSTLGSGRQLGILDTSESDASETDNAIRTYHSVLLVTDSRTNSGEILDDYVPNGAGVQGAHIIMRPGSGPSSGRPSGPDSGAVCASSA